MIKYKQCRTKFVLIADTDWSDVLQQSYVVFTMPLYICKPDQTATVMAEGNEKKLTG